MERVFFYIEECSFFMVKYCRVIILNIQEIVGCMKIHGDDKRIQEIQTAHRLKIVQSMNIKEGMNILEIGCGQGDTLAVLAATVGEFGHVRGIDIASGDYGAPITLNEAAAYLKKSDLGERITIDFETSVDDLSEDITYDAIILSHCLWYFADETILRKLLDKVKNLTSTIHIAEWDIVDVNVGQIAHQMASYIQAYYATINISDANIRTLFTANQVTNELERIGANVTKQIVNATEIQDGQWEIVYAEAMDFQGTILEQQMKTMKESMKYQAINSTESMNSFLLSAVF